MNLPTSSSLADPALRLAFATAVADRDWCVILTKQNTKEKTAPLHTAVEDDRAFTVHVRPELLVFDHDDRGSEKVDRMTGQLDVRQIPYVLTTSGRPGHRHLYVRPDPEQRAATLETATTVGLRRTNAVRPPGTRHRVLDQHSALLHPADPYAALLTLHGVETQLMDLSPRMRFVLHVGCPGSGTTAGRSEQLQAVLTEAARTGVGLDELEPELRRASSPAGRKYQSHAETGDGLRYLEVCWKKALRYVEREYVDFRGVRAVKYIDQVEDSASCLVHGQVTSAVDTAVLLAHLQIGRRIKRTVHSASVREVAELAGVSKETVSRSRRRLVKLGLLRRVKRGAQDRTGVWSLGLPATDRVGTHSSVHTPPSIENVLTVSSNHDAFRNGCGLGKGPWSTYNAVAQLPRDAEALAEASGKHLRTVARHLIALQEVGAVENVDGTWQACEVDWDDVAQNLGVSGRGAAQRLQHRKDRRRHEGFLDSLEQATTKPSSYTRSARTGRSTVTPSASLKRIREGRRRSEAFRRARAARSAH